MPLIHLPLEQWKNAFLRTAFQMVRFFFIIVLLAIISFSALVMMAFQPASYEEAVLNKVISIPVGASGGQIADLLEDAGIVRDARLFRLVLFLTEAEAHLQAGDFLLNPQMAANELIAELRWGKGVVQKVVIPEGFELRQIARLLASRDLVDEERFLQLAGDASLVFHDQNPLDLPISSLEGYLFPDTYRFVRGQTEEEIVRQMVNRFREMVMPLVEAHQFGGISLNLHEIVTLASIVEKEVMVDRERKLVAAVYLNRLAIGMPLQADPTVRYVMEEQRSRVLYRDLEIDSPYNTYRYRGLPPGPIASPGLAAIKAVLEPADVDYLFFVSKRDGTHQFSRTFDEHVRARRQLGY